MYETTKNNLWKFCVEWHRIFLMFLIGFEVDLIYGVFSIYCECLSFCEFFVLLRDWKYGKKGRERGRVVRFI